MTQEHPKTRRRLAGLIIIHGVDDESWPWEDEKITATRTLELYLDVTQPSAQLQVRDVRWGGECRVEVGGVVKMTNDGSVLVEAETRFYEGTSESSMDKEDEASITILVPTDQGPAHRTVKLRNTEPGGGDHATVKFSFTNSPA